MTTTLSSEQNAHLQALKAKHSAISEKLEDARKRPSTADYYLIQLKKQKLILKDTIESLARDTANQPGFKETETA